MNQWRPALVIALFSLISQAICGQTVEDPFWLKLPDRDKTAITMGVETGLLVAYRHLSEMKALADEAEDQ